MLIVFWEVVFLTVIMLRGYFYVYCAIIEVCRPFGCTTSEQLLVDVFDILNILAGLLDIRFVSCFVYC